MRQYEAKFTPLQDISLADRQAMASLYLGYFDGATQELFLADLEGKTEALLVYHQAQLVGFSTLQVYDHSWNGQPIRVIYSGDTIVAREHWGQQALAFSWIERMGEIKRMDPAIPLYWFLIVKGHRTFRYLPAFSKSFYPHYSLERPDLKPLADTLAREKFGGHYDAATGIVVFPSSRGHLKREIALPTAAERSKESVRFFLARNPNYARGDEMVCLCELDADNLKPLARRLFTKSKG
jgi:hypothetical protein